MNLLKFQLSYFDNPLQDICSYQFCWFRTLETGHMSHWFFALGQEFLLVVWKCATLQVSLFCHTCDFFFFLCNQYIIEFLDNSFVINFLSLKSLLVIFVRHLLCCVPQSLIGSDCIKESCPKMYSSPLKFSHYIIIITPIYVHQACSSVRQENLTQYFVING